MNKKINLNEENIKLRIENEVIKKQLISIRDTLNKIIGDSGENELIKMYVERYENYKKIAKLEKQVLKQDELKRCINCQQEGK